MDGRAGGEGGVSHAKDANRNAHALLSNKRLDYCRIRLKAREYGIRLAESCGSRSAHWVVGP